jgi:hypothetical protein
MRRILSAPHVLRSTGRVGAALLMAAAASACGDSLVGDGARAVALSFRVASTSAPQLAAVSGAEGGPSLVAGSPMLIEGTNGTLTISEIRLIVAEVELEGEGDDFCDDDGSDDVDSPGSGGSFEDDCADFEAPPRFLDLPLDGEPVEAFVGLVPPGVYDELEFEIEDLEDDEDDTEFAAEIVVLREQILAAFPDWPRKATALVVGSFESEADGVTEFRVYLEAEIEVEMELNPNLVVGDDGGVAADLTVDIRPDVWFTSADGSVLPLHLYDFDLTGSLLELEVEIEDGFGEIEIDD